MFARDSCLTCTLPLRVSSVEVLSTSDGLLLDILTPRRAFAGWIGVFIVTKAMCWLAQWGTPASGIEARIAWRSPEAKSARRVPKRISTSLSCPFTQITSPPTETVAVIFPPESPPSQLPDSSQFVTASTLFLAGAVIATTSSRDRNLP